MSHSNDKVVFYSLDKRAILPKRQTEGAAGYDLFSINEDIIAPASTKAVKVGFKLDIPDNLLGLVCGRSGLAIRNGIEVVASYAYNSTEVEIFLRNISEVPFHFEKGTRVAQLVFLRLADVKLEP